MDCKDNIDEVSLLLLFTFDLQFNEMVVNLNVPTFAHTIKIMCIH